MPEKRYREDTAAESVPAAVLKVAFRAFTGKAADAAGKSAARFICKTIGNCRIQVVPRIRNYSP